jgi:cell wall-associated NlpC family hydrolase
LTKYAIFQAKGLSLNHYTCDQFNDSRGQKIPFANALPGDLIFYGTDADQCNDHVAIFAGNGTMVEAREHNVPVGTHPLRTGHGPNVVRF